MKTQPSRRTVDLSAYPDLVVIYLGMRVNALTGIKTVIGFGPKISKSADDKPDGLLLHEGILYSLFPPHVGMRQYWRDFDSLEKVDSLGAAPRVVEAVSSRLGGTGFWHEAYFIRGGMEAVYIDIETPIGFTAFAPAVPARGGLFSARRRLNRSGEESVGAPLSETDLYAATDTEKRG